MEQLSGQEMGKIRDAIIDSFDTADFKNLIITRLGWRLADFFRETSVLRDQALDAVIYANNRSWHPKLINALYAERPSQNIFQEFAKKFTSTADIYEKRPDNPSPAGLEALLNASPFLDMSVLIRNLTKIERCVCRVEIEKDDGNEYGTGFLVGKDLILSNYHVFKYVINNPDKYNKVICRFDYKRSPDNKDIYRGTVVKLHQKPIIAYSEFDRLDTEGSPELDVNWPVDKLDYALVRLEREIGGEPYGPVTEGGFLDKNDKNEVRGWISSPTEEINMFLGSSMFIVQHPDKLPMKIAFGLEDVVGTDSKKVRVRYNINTMKGSSGSPCFNEKFQWVALHNMGDPLWNPQYNQGIPAFKIVQDLNTKGYSLIGM